MTRREGWIALALTAVLTLITIAVMAWGAAPTPEMTPEQVFELAKQRAWIESVPTILGAVAGFLGAIVSAWVAWRLGTVRAAQEMVVKSVNGLVTERVKGAEAEAQAKVTEERIRSEAAAAIAAARAEAAALVAAATTAVTVAAERAKADVVIAAAIQPKPAPTPTEPTP